MIENPIRCGFGLGNRVASIAHALSFGNPIEFAWRINEHCPLHHSEIWANGIEGVTMIEDVPLDYASQVGSRMIYDWGIGGSADDVRRAYKTVIDAITIQPRQSPPSVAVFYRQHRTRSKCLVALATAAAKAAQDSPDGRVFLLADSMRASISALVLDAFPSAKIELLAAPELKADMDRPKSDTLAFIEDWRTALEAETIIADNSKTTLTYPAKAAGKRIINTALLQKLDNSK